MPREIRLMQGLGLVRRLFSLQGMNVVRRKCDVRSNVQFGQSAASRAVRQLAPECQTPNAGDAHKETFKCARAGRESELDDVAYAEAANITAEFHIVDADSAAHFFDIFNLDGIMHICRAH